MALCVVVHMHHPVIIISLEMSASHPNEQYKRQDASITQPERLQGRPPAPAVQESTGVRGVSGQGGHISYLLYLFNKASFINVLKICLNNVLNMDDDLLGEAADEAQGADRRPLRHRVPQEARTQAASHGRHADSLGIVVH